MFAYLAADILCRVLFLKRSNLGLKLEHSKTWTIAKNFDMVVEFYTFVICLMKRVFKLYFRADPRISLDELGSETIQVLFRRMDRTLFFLCFCRSLSHIKKQRNAHTHTHT